MEPSSRKLPISIFSELPFEDTTAWEPARVSKVLMEHLAVEPDRAKQIIQNVDDQIRKQPAKNITPRLITRALDEQLIRYGFEDELEWSDNAIRVLERRYLKRDTQGRILERPKDMLARVARTIAAADKMHNKDADTEQLASVFYDLMASKKFMPNSPTLMNAGRDLGQLSACFVLPIKDSMESIFEAVKHTAMIHKSGGGTGFSFSQLRPKDDVVKSTKGVSSGPISFMRVFDTATETIKQGGTRRGANMGILRVDHPDIREFIECKSNESNLNNFNISVGVTEKFMQAVSQDETYDLINPHSKKVTASLSAKEIFSSMVELAWKNGEPGVVFLDRINHDNPTPNVGPIESTNPCGEQPLLPYESCNLGSINLASFVKEGQIDYQELKQTVKTAVHFLDNVIEANRYPLEAIETMTKANRKIGLGVMGYADMLIRMGISYRSNEALNTAEKVMKFIRDNAREASVELAISRGPFDNFSDSTYDQQGHKPLRNATTTTIAPTGTISIIAGCSSGIEPLFGVAYVRNVMDNDELVEVNPEFVRLAKQREFYSPELVRKIASAGSVAGMEEVPADIRDLFVCSHEIPAEWHIKTQAAFQKHTDNAVSKTVNLPHSATIAEVANVYLSANELNCKGVTVYRDGSRSEQVLNIDKVNRAETASFSQAKAPVLVPRRRPDEVHGSTTKINTGCGNLYVTINEDDVGIFEVFTTMGKAGGCSSSQAEAISRLISLSLRAGVDPEAVARQLSGVRCPSPVWKDGEMVLSCADAIARVLKAYIGKIKNRQDKPIPSEQALNLEASTKSVPNHPPTKRKDVSYKSCPDCGCALEHSEGCVLCRACGFSKCG
jgi:ribonucleoside-diphosphate reductase alpha chain